MPVGAVEPAKRVAFVTDHDADLAPAEFRFTAGMREQRLEAFALVRELALATAPDRDRQREREHADDDDDDEDLDKSESA